MWTERCDRRRGMVVVLAAGLAAVALAMVLGTLAMAAPLGFLHVRSNLSRTARLVSDPPDLAVSPKGDWVAVAWTEEYAVGAGYDKGRGHVYLRAAPETGGGWGSKVRVFTGTFNACASDVAVAITGTTAHMAYVVFNDSCNNPNQVLLRYRTCSLTDGRCDASEAKDPGISLDAREYSITWVDLALDAEGNPHLVWSQFFRAIDENKVFFKASDGTAWGGLEYVESNVNSRKPAIAWADGYVHAVWEEETESGIRIRYRRRVESGPNSGWERAIGLCTWQTSFPPRNPDVAARAGKVFVVWDWCSDVDLGGTCLRYNLVYRRSNDRGDGVADDEILEVGTDHSSFGLEYQSTDNLAQIDESLVDLQPSIALNRAGWPGVVWHVDRNSGGGDPEYDIYYAYALTGTEDSVGWITRTLLNAGGGALGSAGSAAIGVGEPEPGGEQHLHIAYVRKPDTANWDVYYDSNEEDRYEHIRLPVVMRTY